MSWETILKAEKATKADVIEALNYSNKDAILEDFESEAGLKRVLNRIKKELETIIANEDLVTKPERFKQNLKELDEHFKEKRTKKPREGNLEQEILDYLSGKNDSFIERLSEYSLRDVRGKRATEIRRILNRKNLYEDLYTKAIQNPEHAGYKAKGTITFGEEQDIDFDVKQEGRKFVYSLPEYITLEQMAQLQGGELDGEIEPTNLGIVLKLPDFKSERVELTRTRRISPNRFTDEIVIEYLKRFTEERLTKVKNVSQFNMILPTSNTGLDASVMDNIYDDTKPMPELYVILENPTYNFEDVQTETAFSLEEGLLSELEQMAKLYKEDKDNFSENIKNTKFEDSILAEKEFYGLLDKWEAGLSALKFKNKLTESEKELFDEALEFYTEAFTAEGKLQNLKVSLENQKKEAKTSTEKEKIEEKIKEIDQQIKQYYTNTDEFFDDLKEATNFKSFLSNLDTRKIDMTGLICVLMDIESNFKGTSELEDKIIDYISDSSDELKEEIISYLNSNYSDLRTTYLDAVKKKMAEIVNTGFIVPSFNKEQPLDYLRGL